MDTAQWPQGIGPSMESVVGRPAQQPSSHMLGLERRAARPQKEAALNCPRCNSTNTKFCYYNNYSLSQPRYFCKTCRRYWTEGGSLRNVPVGGGSRKNKRSSSMPAPSSAPPTASSSSPNSTLIQSNAHTLIPQDFSAPAPAPDHHNHLMMINPNKIMIHAAGQDLNLAYPPPANNQYPNPTSSSHMSAMELLKMKSFPELTASGSAGGGMYASPSMGFGLHASGSGGDVYKPASALNFSLDGFGSNGGKGGGGEYMDGEGVQESGGGGACRLLFPFEDLKNHEHHHNQVHHLEQQHSRRGGHHEDNNASSAAAAAAAAAGYWNNGMIGTGGSW